MRNKKKDDFHYCQCIPYEKIESRKLQQLQNYRGRQMCTWKDIGPFNELKDECWAESSRVNSIDNKPFFPPICESQYVTNPETYKGTDSLAKRGKVLTKSLLSNKSASSVGAKEIELTFHHSSPEKDKNIEAGERGIRNTGDKKYQPGLNNSRVRLPKLK